MDVAERYRRFVVREVRGHSAIYEETAERIAGDPELIAMIEELPEAKRQPNLLLASVRFLGGPVGDYPAFRAWLLAHWDRVRATVLRHRTQTNEAGRCAALLPLLASLPQPLALIEVGASAGLCLYPDRYRYRYDGRPPLGPDDSPVCLPCRTSGPMPLPERPPSVVWRAGVDLNPLDVRDAEQVRWLECLIWPEQTHRLDRLRAAVRVVRAEPPHLVRGDLNEKVRELVGRAPRDATPVVFHSAVLPYLSAGERDAFADTVRSLPGHWVSNESPGLLPSVEARLPRAVSADRAVFALALDERPVAFGGPHGQWLEWFG
ncbi:MULTISPECIES: DUF2332 domain-containing protein [Streptomyces]|uniref:DUF2332 domain-containing protein n=1 Tax=Streptomyces sudanensis TaxID=436397 RepID=A0ABY4TF90_9ACTN|nr:MULTISPECIES: DUF2332 domain-containing protein [Streptomyces]MCP9958892.1 DUF2332 domain-containing protein [Streptomyces sudanensis]MCQ0000630.1 DUF2332 domain-containing protein [Streptomyces sudanensis]URN16216.1 DUF2332 domain-containing protein [Streptomyces sudanensis]